MNITDPRHVIDESKIKNMCRGFKNTRGSVAPQMQTEKHAYGQKEFKTQSYIPSALQSEKYYSN